VTLRHTRCASTQGERSEESSEEALQLQPSLCGAKGHGNCRCAKLANAAGLSAR
jgi:hypothetical protein